MRTILLMMILLFSGLSLANPMQQTNAIAEKCADLNCVRGNIDNIDSQIVALLGQRLAYVKRAGELKGPNVPVHDQAREDKILAKVAQEAESFGYPGTIARALYTTLLQQTNAYEQQFKLLNK